MFTADERDALRDALVTRARADERVAGAAVTGSAALDAADRWSDIDLAFGVADGVPLGEVIETWTGVMYADHGAVHHMDVVSGRTVYRVFLLTSTLQVDLAFSPAAEFRARAATFRLLFGQAAEPAESPPPDAASLIDMAWLHALHARSSIARGRVWQAEYMISAVRDHALALCCLRHGLPAVQGRGMDQLPPGATDALTGAIVCSLDRSELSRAFRVAIEALLTEISHADAALADRLAAVLRELALSPALDG